MAQLHVPILVDWDDIKNHMAKSDIVEVVRCKDCKHQEKVWHEDNRKREGGYYIYGCDLVDGYAPVGFDDEYCSRAERRDDDNNRTNTPT